MGEAKSALTLSAKLLLWEGKGTSFPHPELPGGKVLGSSGPITISVPMRFPDPLQFSGVLNIPLYIVVFVFQRQVE